MSPRDRCAEACCSPLLPLEQALERLLGALEPIASREWLPLKQARGRLLAEEIRAPLDLPPFPNAGMDGYALRSDDAKAQTVLRVIGIALAGQPFRNKIAPGECVRLFTGAALPAGADAVVAQEDTRREGDVIHLAARVSPGENIRPRGDDIRAGQALLPAGQCLTPADLGLLASAGLSEVAVKRRLRVAFFSTGDELRPVWQALGPGEIHDGNRYVLEALLAELGVEPVDFGNLPDDPNALRRTVLEAASMADAVISSGGASVGDADFVVEVLRDIGRVEFWKIAVKPGKPFVFGQVGATPWFGLPGNPVSMMVTFRQLVRPALARLMGTAFRPPWRPRAICDNRLVKAPGRLEFQRGVYRHIAGQFIVTGLAGQGAHRLSSMSQANCFIVLPVENAGIEPGGEVDIEPFDGSF